MNIYKPGNRTSPAEVGMFPAVSTQPGENGNGKHSEKNERPPSKAGMERKKFPRWIAFLFPAVLIAAFLSAVAIAFSQMASAPHPSIARTSNNTKAPTHRIRH